MDPTKLFGPWLAEAMRLNDFDAATMAKLLDTAPSNISRMVAGLQSPSVHVLHNFEHLFGGYFVLNFVSASADRAQPAVVSGAEK